MNREAQILQALQGNLASEAKRALVAELNTIRSQASRRVAVAREVELGKEAAAAHLTPAQPYVRHTTETDWLGRVASTRHTAAEIHQMAKSAAASWFRQTAPIARANPTELNIQAVGQATLWAGQFGDLAPMASSSFLQSASHLAGVKFAADENDDPEEDQDDPEESYEEADDDDDTDDGGNPFADDSKKEGSLRTAARAQTKFTLCPAHKNWFSGDTRYRMAETFGEGGPGSGPSCSGDGCKIAPGTDLFWEGICDQEYSTRDMSPGNPFQWSVNSTKSASRKTAGRINWGYTNDGINGRSSDDRFGFNVHQVGGVWTLDVYDDRANGGDTPIDSIVCFNEDDGKDSAQEIANRYDGGSARYGSRTAEWSGEKCNRCGGNNASGSDRCAHCNASIDPGTKHKTSSISMDDVQRWCDRNGCVMKDFPDELIEAVAESGDLEQLGSYLDDMEAAEIGERNDDFRHTPDHDGYYGSLRTAGEGMTCSVCGDAMTSTDGSYHHDNGTKHDHEAKPGKESSRRTAGRTSVEYYNGHGGASYWTFYTPGNNQYGSYDSEAEATAAAAIWEEENPTLENFLTAPGPYTLGSPRSSSLRTAGERCGATTQARIGNQTEMTVTCSKPAGHTGDHQGVTLDSDDNAIMYRFSVKTAASPDFKSYPKNRAQGQEWSTTCSVCGGTETGTDYYNGWPSQDAFHNHLFCGHDPSLDYHQDLAIDRYSSRRTAEADGIDSPSPQSQNGYAESTLDDVSVTSAPEDTNMGWIAEGDSNAVTGSMGHFEAMFMRSAADQVTSGPLYDAASKDSSLGVGHVWTNTSCPAYKTYDPKDCTCAKKSASRTAASEGWWPLVPDDRYPGENKLVCPACGSPDVSISGNNLGRDIINNNLYTSLTCNSCGRRDILPEKPKDLRGASRKHAEADGIDSPSPQSQNGYAETTLTDVSVGSAPDDTNLGWIADGDPNAEDEASFEAPDNPIANEASINAHFASLVTAGENDRPAGAAPMVDQVTNDPEDDTDMFGGEWIHEGGRRQALHPDDDPNQGPGYLNDSPNLLGDPPGMDPEDYDMFAPELPREARKTAMPSPAEAGISVGDIFYNSWGYDQTNVDFYKVIRLTGAGAEIVPIGSKYVEQNGPGGNKVVPDPDHVRDWDVITGIERGSAKKSKVCKITSSGGLVLRSGEHWASKWRGGSMYETDSMFGR